MRITENILFVLFFCLSVNVFGQTENVIINDTQRNREKPIDDIVKRSEGPDRMVLSYAPIREADILWEKRIWREIDTREKMNLPFRYPLEPFFGIMKKGIESGEIIAYSAEDDKFTTPLQTSELALQFYSKDTVQVIDPVTGEINFREVETEINPLDVKRFRIKEVWFFDTNRSEMRVRILGMAPIHEVFDEEGNFLYEYPLFWIYYPHCRDYFAQYKVINEWNDKNTMTWEDLMEMRFFSSYITKETNVNDQRLQDMYSGREMLLEGERIKLEIMNYESDLWSY